MDHRGGSVAQSHARPCSRVTGEDQIDGQKEEERETEGRVKEQHHGLWLQFAVEAV